MASTSPSGRERLERAALPAILLLALLVRLPGHFHAATLHFDEGMEIDAVVNSFPPAGSVRHPFLNRYLLLAAEGVYYGFGRLAGEFESVGEFGERFDADPRPFLYVGRSICLISGLFTVFLVYRLGRRVWNRDVGLGGALLLAVSPGHILVSNNVRSWSLGTCLATLTLLLSVRMISARGRRPVFLAGLAAGFSVASVYILGLLAVPLACALLARRRIASSFGRLAHLAHDALLVLAGTATGFLVGDAGAFVHRRALVRVLRTLSERDAAHTVGAYLTNVMQYLGSIGGDFGLGAVLACVSALGLVVGCARPPRGWWVLLSFPLCVLVLQPASLYLWAGRYAVPAYPVLVLAAASCLATGRDFLARLRPRSARMHLFAASLCLLVALNLVTVVPYARAARRTPTREMARKWIEENVPAGTGIALTIRYVSPALRAIPRGGEAALGGGERPAYDLFYLPLVEMPTLEEEEDSFRDSIRGLAGRGFAYVVFTDPVPPAERIRRKEENFERSVLDRECTLVRRFLYEDVRKLPDDTALVNPEVRVYRLRT